MASALNVILDYILKTEFVSSVMDCVSNVVMPINASSVSLMFQSLIKKINVNVKPAFIWKKNKKVVFLALKYMQTVLVVIVVSAKNVRQDFT